MKHKEPKTVVSKEINSTEEVDSPEVEEEAEVVTEAVPISNDDDDVDVECT